MRPLTWHEGYLYAGRGYSLFRINGETLLNKAFKWEKVATFDSDLLRKVASKNRIFERFLRIGFHSLRILPDLKMIAVVAKNITLLEPEGKKFKSTCKIKRGTRPLGITKTPDGKVYWGEYFNNFERDEVHIYGSADGGYTWNIVYTFPKRTIRHIHNIYYDPYENCFWVLTGDEDKEPRIIKVSPDWKWIDVILEGNQQARIVTMILRENSIFYATDTPYEQNYIYRLNRKTGKIEKVFPLPGPSMWSTSVDNMMFFSTASEPGEIYFPFACLFGSSNGENWMEIMKWRKDKFYPKLFQYGNIILPYGSNEYRFLAATGRAVKKEDGWLTIWKVKG